MAEDGGPRVESLHALHLLLNPSSALPPNLHLARAAPRQLQFSINAQTLDGAVVSAHARDWLVEGALVVRHHVSALASRQNAAGARGVGDAGNTDVVVYRKI